MEVGPKRMLSWNKVIKMFPTWCLSWFWKPHCANWNILNGLFYHDGIYLDNLGEINKKKKARKMIYMYMYIYFFDGELAKVLFVSPCNLRVSAGLHQLAHGESPVHCVCRTFLEILQMNLTLSVSSSYMNVCKFIGTSAPNFIELLSGRFCAYLCGFHFIALLTVSTRKGALTLWCLLHGNKWRHNVNPWWTRNMTA